jgi:hypothetical protein|tara:strand:- start:925 stop:1530 length:606 start_codon:yes stop_codon:yes gene_type:complete
MSISTNKLIFKRLIREYEFLLEDLVDIESANLEIKNEFMKALSDIDDEGILETKEMDHMADDWSKNVKESEDLEKETNKHPDFKKLFRKSVIMCHPDKLEHDLDQERLDVYKEIYEDLVDANETEDWAKLIRCSVKLEIELPESAYDQIESIEHSISKLKEKQINILNSTSWLWYKTNAGESKENILKQHLDFMKLLTKKK